MKRFHLVRNEDETGVSGTGVITDGIEFSDGSVIMKWNTNTTSLTLYASMADVVAIHGHNGKTVVEYVDDDFEIWPEFLHSYPLALQYLV